MKSFTGITEHDSDELFRRWQTCMSPHLMHPSLEDVRLASRLLVPFDDWCRRFEALASQWGFSVRLDEKLLSDRARWMGLTQGGQISANGHCHLLNCRDGWIAINLAREEDCQLLPAWLQQDMVMPVELDALKDHVGGEHRHRLIESAVLLGLPCAAVGEIAADASTYCAQTDCAQTDIVPVRHRVPRVLDLSALWAGPLCAQLLRQAGGEVTRVESASRPDPVRHSCPPLYQQLHHGKKTRQLNLMEESGRRALRKQLERTDILITSCRPRAFSGLGLDVEAVFRINPDLLWLSITAYGHAEGCVMRVGFGDDCAVAGGLIVGNHQPQFIGDAIADPLTGLRAAVETLERWKQGCSGLLDISLAQTAAQSAESAGLRSRLW